MKRAVLLLAILPVLAGCGGSAKGTTASPGSAAATALIERWGHVKLPTKTIYLQNVQESLAKLPASERATAKAAMLAYLPTVEKDQRNAEGG